MALTDKQAALLKTLKTLPARYRLSGRVGAPLRLEVLDHYDARVWAGLFRKGYLYFKSDGFNAT